jgi:hypothetical protein
MGLGWSALIEDDPMIDPPSGMCGSAAFTR